MSTPRARVRSPIILQTNQTNKNNCSDPLHIHDLLISSIRMHLDTNSVCLGSSTGASVDAFLKHNEYQFFYSCGIYAQYLRTYLTWLFLSVLELQLLVLWFLLFVPFLEGLRSLTESQEVQKVPTVGG